LSEKAVLRGARSTKGSTDQAGALTIWNNMLVIKEYLILNRNYIGMIEREENSPTVDAIEQISGALGIDPVLLFQDR
jgi:hypothetical protein